MEGGINSINEHMFYHLISLILLLLFGVAEATGLNLHYHI